ncbi:MAG: pantetheine-phosphate adenylyltransferase [bacterium]|nr:pantetheine-phosphate adenylyltransferase [bacterium]
MKQTIFPGTFDPVTNGHLDLVQRALHICEHLVVAVAGNPPKQPLFSTEERTAMIAEAVGGYGDRVSVRAFPGLLVDFAREIGIHLVIRGVRGVADFEDEFRMALANRRLFPQFETLFLMPSEIYTYLNSSLVKEIARLGGDLSHFVPPAVERALQEKLAANGGRI